MWGESQDNSVMDQGLSVALVARRLGVAPATLRTWDHRYGLGPSEHREGTHRRYSAGDLARLEHMQRLVRTGFTPRDAAAAVLAAPAPTTQPPQPPAPPAGLPDRAATAAMVQGLKASSLALDVRAAAELISEAIEANGVVWTWDDLLLPTMAAFGDTWSRSGLGVETEHALSEVVSAAFSRTTYAATKHLNDRPILLASAPNEQHTLPLEAIAAALAELGVGTRFLGARVPFDSLMLAVRRTGPRAVILWSSIHNAVDLSAISTIRPAPRWAIGGPGWSTSPPAGWAKFESLGQAVTQLAAWAAD